MPAAAPLLTVVLPPPLADARDHRAHCSPTSPRRLPLLNAAPALPSATAGAPPPRAPGDARAPWPPLAAPWLRPRPCCSPPLAPLPPGRCRRRLPSRPRVGRGSCYACPTGFP
nr:DBF4-type zinc finger-containing protein 2 homolog [Aegilops tauschii subsp. strangulata]